MYQEEEFYNNPPIINPTILPTITTWYYSHVDTKDFLKEIISAVDHKPINLWLSSCQSNRLHKDIENILPKGSTFITENNGPVNPIHLLVAFEAVLKNENSFQFKDLEENYIKGDGHYNSICYIDNNYYMRLLKTILHNNGKETIDFLDQYAKQFYKDVLVYKDILLHSLLEENIPEENLNIFQKLKKTHIDNELKYIISDNMPLSIEQFTSCHNNYDDYGWIEQLFFKIPHNKDIEKCIFPSWLYIHITLDIPLFDNISPNINHYIDS